MITAPGKSYSAQIFKVFLAVSLFGATFTASAELLPRDLDGNAENGYEAYFDSDQNITWLTDANYSKSLYRETNGTQGDSDGLLDHTAAKAWAESISIYNTTGWRLPKGSPPCYWNGSGGGCAVMAFGTWNEMSVVYQRSLSNLAAIGLNGEYNYDYGLVNAGPFLNLHRTFIFWTDDLYAPEPTYAWYFNPESGILNINPVEVGHHVWLTRDGDIASAVPEPSSTALLTMGALMLFCLAVRRRSAVA